MASESPRALNANLRQPLHYHSHRQSGKCLPLRADLPAPSPLRIEERRPDYANHDGGVGGRQAGKDS